MPLIFTLLRPHAEFLFHQPFPHGQVHGQIKEYLHGAYHTGAKEPDEAPIFATRRRASPIYFDMMRANDYYATGDTDADATRLTTTLAIFRFGRR